MNTAKKETKLVC